MNISFQVYQGHISCLFAVRIKWNMVFSILLVRSTRICNAFLEVILFYQSLILLNSMLNMVDEKATPEHS